LHHSKADRDMFSHLGFVFFNLPSVMTLDTRKGTFRPVVLHTSLS